MSPSGKPQLNLASFSSLPSDPLVPLEHTNTLEGTFSRLEVPLSLYLSYLNNPPPSLPGTLYLAQFQPPSALLDSIPLPSFLSADSTKYRHTHSSIWLGLTPTTTPLHRDPDSNILYQLAGCKTVRLCAPSVGEHVLDLVRCGQREGKMRGEEMMRPGEDGERDVLEAAVWEDDPGDDFAFLRAEGGTCEAELTRGDALYIPKGWWHAVRGRKRQGSDEEINASVNWWFR
jgi:hypothetical protein